MKNEQISQLLTQYGAYEALLFVEDTLVLNAHSRSPFHPFARTIQQLNLQVNQLQVDGKTVIVDCACQTTPEKWVAPFELISLRIWLSQVPSSLQTRILSAYQWLKWDPLSQYCGKCGQLLDSTIGMTEKKCAHCHISFFPKFSVAVMVLIYREQEILLARSGYFRPGVYSAIAGFVEKGETAEEAAHREVKEELNLEITQLEYFASQSWPFPDSFMLAFKARYHRGELKIDRNELEDAQWFKADNLPQLPYPGSVAYRLIQSHLAVKEKI